MAPPPVPGYRNHDRGQGSRYNYPASASMNAQDAHIAPSGNFTASVVAAGGGSSDETAESTYYGGESAKAASYRPTGSSANDWDDSWGAGPPVATGWGTVSDKSSGWGLKESKGTKETSKEGSRPKENSPVINSWGSLPPSGPRGGFGWGEDRQSSEASAWDTIRGGSGKGRKVERTNESSSKETSAGGNGWGSVTGESFVSVAGSYGSVAQDTVRYSDIAMVDEGQQASGWGGQVTGQTTSAAVTTTESNTRNDPTAFPASHQERRDSGGHSRAEGIIKPKMTGENAMLQIDIASRWGKKSNEGTARPKPVQPTLEIPKATIEPTAIDESNRDATPRQERSLDSGNPTLASNTSKPELTLDLPFTISPLSEAAPPGGDNGRNTGSTSTNPRQGPIVSPSYQPMSAVALHVTSPLMSAQTHDGPLEPLSAVSSRGQKPSSLTPRVQEWTARIEVLTRIIDADLARRHLQQSDDSRRHLVARISRKTQLAPAIPVSLSGDMERRKNQAETEYRNAFGLLRSIILKDGGSWWSYPRFEHQQTEEISKLTRETDELKHSVSSVESTFDHSMNVNHSPQEEGELTSILPNAENRLVQIPNIPTEIPSYREMRSEIDHLQVDLRAALARVADKREELPNILEQLLDEVYPSVDLSQVISEVSLDDRVAVLSERYRNLDTSAQQHLRTFKMVRSELQSLGTEASAQIFRLRELQQEREGIETEYREVINRAKTLREQSNSHASLVERLQTRLRSEQTKAQILNPLIPQLVNMATERNQESENFLKSQVEAMRQNAVEEEGRLQSQRQARYQELLSQVANNPALVDMRRVGDRIDQIWTDVISPAPARPS